MTLLWTGFLFIGSVNAELIRGDNSPLMARDVDGNDPIRTDELVANIDEVIQECPCDMYCCREVTWNGEPRCAQIATDYGCLMVHGLEGELTELEVAQNNDAEFVRGDNGAEGNECCQCCLELTWNWEPRCAQIATDYGCLMVQGLEGELAEFVVVPEEGRSDVIGRFVSNSGWLLPYVVIGNVLLCVGAASIIRRRKDIEYEAITDKLETKSTTLLVSE